MLVKSSLLLTLEELTCDDGYLVFNPIGIGEQDVVGNSSHDKI